jgi:hypothetical protein
VLVLTALAIAACEDGEVGETGTGAGTATGTATGTGAGTATGTAAGTATGTATGSLPCPTGQTIGAASPELDDVRAAVALAADGDTITVPAGEATWAESLQLDKAVTLRGAGAEGASPTRLRRDGGTIIELSLSADLPVRITGLRLSFPEFSLEDRYAIAVTSTSTQLRIDHCTFDFGSRTIFPTGGQNYGVIDHCVFNNPDAAIHVINRAPDDAEWGDAEWGRPLVLGGADTLVVEDCLFQRDGGTTSDTNEIVYGQGASKVTFRHNVVDNRATPTPLAAIDAHGYMPDTSRGTLLYEIYENEFRAQWTYRYANLRGGHHLIFGNAFTDEQGGATVLQLKNEGSSTYGAYDATDELSGCYFWDNTYNGASVDEVGIEESSVPYVHEGANYDLRAPAEGDAIFPYVPLSYPHPRVVADDACE